MRSRARAFYRARRAVAASWTAVAALGFAVLVALGAFRSLALPSRGIGALACALGLGALVVGRLSTALRGTRRVAPHLTGPVATRARRFHELRDDLELGAILLIATFAMLQATGGEGSPLYPLAYALVAFLVAFHRPAVGLALVGVALTLEAALFVAGNARDGVTFGMHLGFVAFFALIHLAFLHAELMRQRREHRLRLDAEVARMRQEARDFRVISSQLGADSRNRTRAEEEERLAQGAVETIHQALFYNLELLKTSLDLHTAILLWLDATGEKLIIKELCSDSERVREGELGADAGAPGTVAKSGESLMIVDPKPGHLPYYEEPEAIAAFLAVPVLEDGHLRGVLCADRLQRAADGEAPTAAGFTERDQKLLAGAALQILRAVRSERVFCAVERGKYEHERFYRASEQLNRALTPDEVFATAFRAAREMSDFDFAAIALYDAQARRHTIAAATGDGAEGLAGQTFGDNAGLAAMVVKNKHYLPAGGELRDREVPIFNKKIRLKGMESLVVLPLVCADEAIGTFTLAARRHAAFVKDKREMLGVIANQVAVSTKNAEMYRAMEQMATTDGLTGLVNHRTFQERFGDLISRAERQGGKLALLLTDIDHFKKVNDTYGHPTGDIVLKGVAAVCRDEVRKIDIAARYGGEEFAIVLDGTDLAGARLLAERIRSEVQALVHAPAPESGKEPFGCTLSLGIACFPDDGRDKKALIGHADQALYFAKHNGRNRAIAWADAAEHSRPQIRAVK